MEGHWTYSQPDKEVLFQGDILSRSERLRKLLEEVHPYFAKEQKYQHFMLLTQSCDLVRRGGGQCKAPYLTVAAIREVTDVLVAKEILNVTRGEAIGRVVSASSAERVREFLRRLVNNNDPNYFFLRADASQGLGANYCACLRVTVPLRIEHYDMLLEAKIGQLREVFQAKLGWLVGNNYSRVGTPDWNDSKPALDALVAELTDMLDVVEDRKLKQIVKVLKKDGIDPTEAGVRELHDDPRAEVRSRRQHLRAAFDTTWPEGAAFPDRGAVKASLGETEPLETALRDGLQGIVRDDVDLDEAAVRLAKSDALRDALHSLVDRSWPEFSPPTSRKKFLGRFENAAGFSDALKEP